VLKRLSKKRGDVRGIRENISCKSPFYGPAQEAALTARSGKTKRRRCFNFKARGERQKEGTNQDDLGQGDHKREEKGPTTAP